jgi:hypothetical protein
MDRNLQTSESKPHGRDLPAEPANETILSDLTTRRDREGHDPGNERAWPHVP